MSYTFKKSDSGIIGKAFEMSIKEALNRSNAGKVSPCGQADFRFNHKNYDTKQNGSCIQYTEGGRYIKGSNRVLYASHVAYRVTEETLDLVTIEVDLFATEIFVLDRKEFLDFLLSSGLAKRNASRGTVNIQTGYNYKLDSYHGRAGKKIEAWAREHELNDDIVTIVYDNLEG